MRNRNNVDDNLGVLENLANNSDFDQTIKNMSKKDISYEINRRKTVGEKIINNDSREIKAGSLVGRAQTKILTNASDLVAKLTFKNSINGMSVDSESERGKGDSYQYVIGGSYITGQRIAFEDFGELQGLDASVVEQSDRTAQSQSQS